MTSRWPAYWGPGMGMTGDEYNRLVERRRRGQAWTPDDERRLRERVQRIAQQREKPSGKVR